MFTGLGAVLFNCLPDVHILGSNPVSVIRKASERRHPNYARWHHRSIEILETICARCLERDPKARYQSAGDLAADLERWLGGVQSLLAAFTPSADLALVAA